jgi:hypothetical protein
MAKPTGLQSKLKDNSKRNYRAREEWQTGKKLGRKKQVWVPSTLNGNPLSPYLTMDEIDVAITEETIANGSYVSAHWGKV